ncbi:hypothetical protein [Demequina gelatinilytica]|uniref:hypothetical protein n=1 Tax=Demequina gelatinilytica TaxID=1638980 RepID=UPI000786217E|nr:hypothetical protein [Demequina gelatinilytica]
MDEQTQESTPDAPGPGASRWAAWADALRPPKVWVPTAAAIGVIALSIGVVVVQANADDAVAATDAPSSSPSPVPSVTATVEPDVVAVPAGSPVPSATPSEIAVAPPSPGPSASASAEPEPTEEPVAIAAPQVWNAAYAGEVRSLGATANAFFAVDTTPDGAAYVARATTFTGGYESSLIYVGSVAGSGPLQARKLTGSTLTTIELAPTGHELLIGTSGEDGHALEVVDVVTGDVSWSVDFPGRTVVDAQWSPSGDSMVVSLGTGRDWSLDGTASSIVVVDRASKRVTEVAMGARGTFAPDGRAVVYYASHDGEIRLYRTLLASGTEQAISAAALTLEDPSVYALSTPVWDPTGEWGAYTYSQGDGDDHEPVRLFAADGSGDREVPGVSSYRGIRWAPSGQRFSVIGWDGVAVVDVDDAAHPDELDESDIWFSGLEPLSVAWTPDSSGLIINGTTRSEAWTGLYDVESVDLMWLPVEGHRYSGAVWAADGRWLIEDNDGALVARHTYVE